MGCFGSKPIPPNPLEVDLTHFELLKVVGKGGFGKVNAITKLDTQELMALKRMEKYAVLQSSSHLKMVWIERKIMSLTNSPFLCNLLYAFESERELFLVMPFMQGGDLRFHLKERGTMNTSMCKFYACEMILGLAAMHEKRVVFRDLKPDNMLLDAQGHLRISDFGLACILEERNNWQTSGQAGTRGYQSPEVITDQWYGCEVDIWSFGVTVYELLHGVRPWKDWTRLQAAGQQVQQQQGAAGGGVADANGTPKGADGAALVEEKNSDKVSESQKDNAVKNMRQIHISSKLDAVTADFLTRILQVDKKKRLGCNGGWEEVKSHQWFRDVDWEKISRKEVQPPITPDLTRANCFPEENTRILTDQGFMFLEQIMQHTSEIPLTSTSPSSSPSSSQRLTIEPPQSLNFACYDPDLHTINYQPASRLVVLPPQQRKLVEFHLNQQDPTQSIRVTGTHDMYVQRATCKDVDQQPDWSTAEMHKVTADELLEAGQETTEECIRLMSVDDKGCTNATSSLSCQRDITTSTYNGRVWCVTVPTGLIVAQRADRDETGVVTHVSPSLVLGNCTADADLADQLLDRKPRDIPPDQQHHFRGWKFRTELSPQKQDASSTAAPASQSASSTKATSSTTQVKVNSNASEVKINS